MYNFSIVIHYGTIQDSRPSQFFVEQKVVPHYSTLVFLDAMFQKKAKRGNETFIFDVSIYIGELTCPKAPIPISNKNM